MHTPCISPQFRRCQSFIKNLERLTFTNPRIMLKTPTYQTSELSCDFMWFHVSISSTHTRDHMSDFRSPQQNLPGLVYVWECRWRNWTAKLYKNQKRWSIPTWSRQYPKQSKPENKYGATLAVSIWNIDGRMDEWIMGRLQRINIWTVDNRPLLR